MKKGQPSSLLMSSMTSSVMMISAVILLTIMSEVVQANLYTKNLGITVAKVNSICKWNYYQKIPQAWTLARALFNSTYYAFVKTVNVLPFVYGSSSQFPTTDSQFCSIFDVWFKYANALFNPVACTSANNPWCHVTLTRVGGPWATPTSSDPQCTPFFCSKHPGARCAFTASGMSGRWLANCRAKVGCLISCLHLKSVGNTYKWTGQYSGAMQQIYGRVIGGMGYKRDESEEVNELQQLSKPLDRLTRRKRLLQLVQRLVSVSKVSAETKRQVNSFITYDTQKCPSEQSCPSMCTYDSSGHPCDNTPWDDGCCLCVPA